MYDPKPQFAHIYDHSYGNMGGTNFSNVRRLAQNDQNCTNMSSDQEIVQFRLDHHQESDDSGVCSPPLWKNNSPSPPTSPSEPLLSHHIYRSLSPNSRMQAIVRGQRELMEMVKSMPEASYELSLRDLVEPHHKMETQAPQVERLNNASLRQRGVVGKVKRQDSKKTIDKNMIMRNGSFENKGLFLKMVVPFSLHSKKKTNLASNNNTSGKVSPKPDAVKGGCERDWWKKKFTGSSDSDSSRTSNNSGSTTGSSGGSSSSGSSHSGGRKKKGFLAGCWPFFQSRRRKSDV